MGYAIDRHPEMDQDLGNIAALISEYAGTAIAANKLRQINADVGKLTDFPHVGTLRHEIYPELRAIPTAEKGVIAFTVDDATKTVLILSITYAGADWVRIVRNRKV
ncbi:MAG: type II toxin-antitoxin system RelE/ParE family toxin [Ahrensia sp.]|nr:type II toxin-antitoxin system RelE/ParE family toxin [Ahrensia sp.]